MRGVAGLIEALEQTQQGVGIDLLREFIIQADNREAVCVIHLFNGSLPKRCITSAQLRAWSSEAAGIPLWLFDDSLKPAGGLAETASLVIPEGRASEDKPLSYWMRYVRTLSGLTDAERKEGVISAWRELHPSERILFNRLLCGGPRIGVAPRDLAQALASIKGVHIAIIAQRLARAWDLDTTTLDELLGGITADEDVCSPYPFSLASMLQEPPAVLGNPGDWHAEWLRDGIRAQIIKQHGRLCVWSRSEDLLTHSLPGLHSLMNALADGTVLEGQILALDGKQLLPPSQFLSPRRNRRTSSRHAHVVFIAHDILEQDGHDITGLSFRQRRARLSSTLNVLPRNDVVRLSPLISFATWDELTQQRARAREYGARGIVLKRIVSSYSPGRDHGGWWKWKASPLVINAVLLYSHGVRDSHAGSSTEYTFAVWDKSMLVPCVRTGEGLSKEEIAEIEAFVQEHALERFGPVRTVSPALVFEITFDAIYPSARRKSGVVLTSARVQHWWRDKKPDEADHLELLRALVPSHTWESLP